jgi:hypothetical protein
MTVNQRRSLVALAVAGLTSGLTACGSSTPPAQAPAAGEPAGEKHSCSGKNGCSGSMKDDEQPSEAAPPEKSK